MSRSAQREGTPTSIPLLEARDLHTHYGTSHVLRGIDFSVRAGEIVALMGRNGMGKTTLLRSLLGLTRASRGEILLDGEAIGALAPFRIARRGLAYVPEARGIFPLLTAPENLLLAARPATGGSVWTLDRVLAVFPRLAP